MMDKNQDPYSIPCTDEEWEAIKYWLHNGPPIVMPIEITWVEEDGKIIGAVKTTRGQPYFLGKKESL
jgi:hypothetical protein